MSRRHLLPLLFCLSLPLAAHGEEPATDPGAGPAPPPRRPRPATTSPNCNSAWTRARSSAPTSPPSCKGRKAPWWAACARKTSA